jgi:ferric-dicitrate binding protein FerR (iron transport regulator)
VSARLRIGLAAALLLAAPASLPLPPPAGGEGRGEGGRAGTVSFLAGDATRTASGKVQKLALGSKILQGDVLETQRRTRLEVKLGDGSVLRLGPSSRATVEAAAFGKSVDERKVSAKLLVGKVWANVAKAVGGEQRFEVQTENAVAGVRGTTFRVDAATDRSVVVKVYSGTVAVASGPVQRPEHRGEGAEPVQTGAKPERSPIAGPREVTREQWERIVTSMMEVRVSSEGVPDDPRTFALAGKQDEWEDWNRDRDAALGLGDGPAGAKER